MFAAVQKELKRIKCSVRTISIIWLAMVSSLGMAADYKVIGYIASFNDMAGTLEKTDLSKLTHINISFANPDQNGDLTNNGSLTCMTNGDGQPVTVSELQAAIDKAQAAGVKVLISVAGGVIPACAGNWAQMLKPENRSTLVTKLIAFMDGFGLDGIDIDIEGGLLTSIDNAGNYTPFIEALSTELKAKHKLLTCATASYVGGMIPESSIKYFDFVNIMSYDAIGPSWGTAGTEHSTYGMAQDQIALWKDRGLTQAQLVLGIPFYGYGFGTYNSDYTFARIVTEFGTDAGTKDVVGSACAGCNYITYNGFPTIRAKTQLAMSEGSGIMIWELSQDASGANSLLAAVDDELNHPSATSSSAASSTMSSVAASQVSSSPTSKASSGSSGGGVGLLLLLPLWFGFRRLFL